MNFFLPNSDTVSSEGLAYLGISDSWNMHRQLCLSAPYLVKLTELN